MPGWVAGNAVIALTVSFTCKTIFGMENRGLRCLIVLGVIVISTAVGILGVKSLVEMLLYAQPFLLRVAKNGYAFIADVVVMAASIPVCEKKRV